MYTRENILVNKEIYAFRTWSSRVRLHCSGSSSRASRVLGFHWSQWRRLFIESRVSFHVLSVGVSESLRFWLMYLFEVMRLLFFGSTVDVFPHHLIFTHYHVHHISRGPRGRVHCNWKNHGSLLLFTVLHGTKSSLWWEMCIYHLCIELTLPAGSQRRQERI